MIGSGEPGRLPMVRRDRTLSLTVIALFLAAGAAAVSCSSKRPSTGDGGRDAGDGGNGSAGSGAAGAGAAGTTGGGGGGGGGGVAGTGGGDGGTAGAGSGGGGTSDGGTGAGGTGAGGTGGGGAGGAAGAVDYTSWTFCGRDGGDRPEVRQCLCSAANQCTAHYGEIYFGLGSEMFRICGFRDGQCTVAAFREREGAGQGYACSLPLGGNSCTSGQLSFDQIASRCTPTFQCNILIGNCPSNFTACPP